MDFSYLLDLAKQNEEHAKEAVQIKRYSTQVSASKKEPRSAVQSQAIRTFLAKKDQEEKKKRLEDLKKKETLLSLRAQDRKSNARVQAMLKRTKAANKAVLDDVRSSTNTAVTAQGLDVQPDEDDYGYVSHEASALYKKLIDKYSSSAADQSNNQTGRSRKELSNAKDRVKDALNKIEEQETSGHRKRRTHKSAVGETVVPNEKKSCVVSHTLKNRSNHSDKEASKKSRPKALPPEAALSFDQILKLAAAKQHEPVKFEKKLDVAEKKETDNERLMTKKEREDLIRKRQEERDRQLRKEGKLPPIAPPVASVTPAPQQLSKNKEKILLKATTSSGKESVPAPPTAVVKTPIKAPIQLPKSVNNKLPPARPDPQRSIPAKPNNVQRPPVSKVAQAVKAGPLANRDPPARMQQQSQLPRGPPNKGKSLAPSGGSRPFPPYRDIRPIERHDPYKRPMESDSEEEEDSELDDFIDDGPDGTEDYSKAIKEIFGYDRSRYRRIESDDDECMESSFAQQMKEECISTKIGIMEDLEEERLLREEEERKKKSAKRLKTRK